jgi:hypothetical protein
MTPETPEQWACVAVIAMSALWLALAIRHPSERVPRWLRRLLRRFMLLLLLSGCSSTKPTAPLVLFAIGESGMSGRAHQPGLPAGYPPAKGLWLIDDDLDWRPLTEPTDAPPKRPVQRALAEGVPAGYGPAGLVAWHMQKRSGRPVVVVQASKGGSTSEQWERSLYDLAVERLRLALDVDGAELGAVIVYQGINDAVKPREPVAARWRRIMAKSHEAFGRVRWVFVRPPATVPTDTSYPGWQHGRDEIASLDGDGVTVVDSPDGPFDGARLHLETPGVVELAESISSALAHHMTADTL